MRILHVITSLEIGGAEKLMVDLLPRLNLGENHVDLLLFNGTRTIFTDNIEKAGITVYSFSKNTNVYTPLNIFRLIPYLKKYDIIHTHNTACQLFVPIAKALSFAKCKLVTTEHNTTNRRRGRWWFKLIDLWMYSKYATIVGVSKETTENIKKYLKNKKSANCVTTICNGIDFDLFYNAGLSDVRQELKLSGDTKLITMVARFDGQKNQQALIRSAEYLSDNCHILLVGGGDIDIKQTCIELTNSLRLSKRVHFVGIRHDIPRLLKSSDIIVLSSHYEGLSLSSIEAMASGRPFVASDVPGLREVVKGAGVLFPDGDYYKLAQIIEHLLSDKDYYKSVSTTCSQRAKEYDINITANLYGKLYNNL